RSPVIGIGGTEVARRRAALPAWASAPVSAPWTAPAPSAPAERTRACPQAPPKGGCECPVRSATMVRRGPPPAVRDQRTGSVRPPRPTLRDITPPAHSVGRAAPPCSGRPPMLWTLLRHHLRPYLPHVGAVIVLQLATILATLYLPSLNADIIDNGVATGDTAYIWRVGGLMLGVAMIQVIT